MTKEELITKLQEQWKNGDTEAAHGNADDLLLEFINDEEVTNAYNQVEKWYA